MGLLAARTVLPNKRVEQAPPCALARIYAPPLQDAPASAAGEGWGGGSDICRYTKSGLKYRPFTYTNPAILYVNCRQCCLGGGAAPP